MLWFKHYTNSNNESFIYELTEEFGIKGIAYWFLFLEAYWQKQENEAPEWQEFNIRLLARQLKTRPLKAQKLLIFFAKVSQLCLSSDTKVTLNCHNSDTKVTLLCQKWVVKLPELKEIKTQEKIRIDKKRKDKENILKESVFLNFDELINIWNGELDKTPHLATSREMLEDFKLLQTQTISGEKFNLSHWKQAISIVAKSDFLKGKSKGGWKATIGWLLKPVNFCSVLNGTYNAPGNKRSRKEFDDYLDAEWKKTALELGYEA